MKKILMFFLLLPVLILSEEFSAHLELPEKQISYDQTFKVILHLKHPENYEINLEALKQNLLSHSVTKSPPFEILEVTQDKKNLIFLLKPLIPGVHLITFKDISFVSKNNTKVVISNIENVNVLPLKKVEEIAFKDVMMLLSSQIPLALNKENQNYLTHLPLAEANTKKFQASSFPFFEVLLIFLISLFIFLTYISKKQLLKIEEKSRDENFLEELQLLQQKDLSAEIYLAEISNLIRRYIEKKYAINAPSLTTQEFLEKIKGENTLSEENKKTLEKFLNLADNIKFAKEIPEKEKIDPITLSALKLITDFT